MAHNARVDYDVLRRQLSTWAPTLMLDTMRLAKALWPRHPSYGLDALLTAAGIEPDHAGKRHRAAPDAYATAMLFIHLAQAAGSPDALHAAAAMPGIDQPVRSQEGLW